MNRVVYSLAIATAAMSSLLCNAQQELVNRMMPKPVPTSPNAAALGKFGDYQVSHFSGLPDISIPLYEVQSGSLKLPITLSYHASGIKPTDVASWVGAGWSLSAGGQISRSIVGKPDEMGFLSAALNASPSACNTFYYLLNSANNVSDTEPDIFNYSIGGKGGKFVWTYSGGPYLVPYSPIKIASTSASFGSFEITDVDGVVHRFGQSGQTANLENTTATSGGNPSTSGTTAWMQDGMFAPNSDDAITITYQQVGTFYTHDISYSYVVMDECYSGNGAACPTNSFIPQQHNIDSYGLQKGPNVITFETGKVKFIMSTSDRLDAAGLKYLDRIEIHNLNDVLQKTIKFVYSYFTNSIGGNAALKLDAVQFKDNAGAIINQYTFSYFTDSFSWNPGSASFLNARDLWGYYNGATGNTDLLLPKTISFQQLYNSTPVNHSFGGALNRAVNATYVKEGVLKRINFPTGGYTEFDFESNKYLNVSTPTLAGGLRVTKITSSDGTTAAPIVKTYKYGNGESGYGMPNFSELQFNYSNTQLSIGEPSPCGGITPFTEFQIRTFQSNTAFGFDSSPVVYPYVTEYIGDPLGTINGKITYVFDSGVPSMDVNHVVPQSSKYYRNSYAWKRGKLTNKTVYDKNNNKLSEANTVYTIHKDESRYIGLGTYLFKPLFSTGCHAYCVNEAAEQVHPDALSFTQFFQNSGAMMETSVVETNFENGNVANLVSTTTSYVYDADKLQQLQSSVTRSNSAENRVTVNLFPFQFSANVNSSSTGAAKGIYMLNTKNILTTPLESYTYLQNSGGTNQRVISSQLTTYRANANNTNHVVADQVFLFESAEPILKTAYTPMTVSGNNIVKDTRYKERLTFVNYDASSNITQVSKTKDIPISYQYGYGNALPIAEIRNAQNTIGLVEFKHEGFEDSSITGVVTDPLQSQSGNKYKNGDFTISFTKPNTRSYVIEYFYYTSPNWIFISKPYTGPTMALTEGSRIDNIRIRPVDSIMSTYTYNPLFGITSITDPNNVTTFYGYDTFGRLQIAQDHNKNAVSTYNYHYKQ